MILNLTSILTFIQLKESVYRIARNHEQYTPSRASPIRLQ